MSGRAARQGHNTTKPCITSNRRCAQEVWEVGEGQGAGRARMEPGDSDGGSEGGSSSIDILAEDARRADMMPL